MEQIEKLPVFGHRGKTYFFSVYLLNHDYPTGAGVYLFTKREPGPNARYTVILIGETPSFNSIHLSLQCGCLQSNGANTICLLPVEKAEDRLAIVQELEERYKPECASHVIN